MLYVYYVFIYKIYNEKVKETVYFRPFQALILGKMYCLEHF